MSRHSRYITAPITAADRAANPARYADRRVTAKLVLAEQSRFSVDELVRLRAERGVGSVARIDKAVRYEFRPTKRKA